MSVETTFGTLLCLRRGRVDPLWNRCALGQEQAPLLAEEEQREAGLRRTLEAWRPARMLCSDLRRARSTAEHLAEELDVPLGVRRELREQAFGVWQGRPWSEIISGEEDRATEFLADFTRARPPGGETLREVAARAVPTVLEAFQRHRRQVVLYVGHAGPIRCLAAAALGLDLAALQRQRLDPFGLVQIRFDGPATSLELWNYPAAGEHPVQAPQE